MRTITLEEHFATPAFLEGPGRKLKEQAKSFGGRAAAVLEQLCDLGDRRIAEMDAASIDVQVLSLTSPGTEQLDGAEAVSLAREANESLADAIRNHPTRFGGLASLPTAAPDAAVVELERAIQSCFQLTILINRCATRALSWTGCRSALPTESASHTGTQSSCLCYKGRWRGHWTAGWSPATAAGLPDQYGLRSRDRFTRRHLVSG